MCVTGVVLSDTVTSIEFNAFYGCPNLQSISIPAATEAIGEDVAAALKDYDIKSFKLLSFEPDENSKMRIQRMSGAMSTPVEKPELTAEQIREANEMAMAMLKAAQSDK